MAALTIDELSVKYGSYTAVDRVNIVLEQGTLAGLIGPNGAGKSSLIDAVCGFTPVSSGRVLVDEIAIHKWNASKRARLGLSRTFQSPQLFADLTVRENLLVANERSKWYDAFIDIFVSNAVRGDHKKVDETLEMLELTDAADSLPGELPLGLQKMVSVGRALVASPRFLLLDEPAAGLDNDESRELGLRLRVLPAQGIGVLLVDHDMSLVLDVCDPVHVIDFGKLIANGSPADIRANRLVIAAYLGGQAEDVAREVEAVADEIDSGILNVAVGTRGEDSTDESSVSFELGIRVAPQRSPSEPTTKRRGEAFLVLKELDAGYDGLAVVRNLDLQVNKGEVVVLLGPNGAGKTTTLLTISGILPAIAGAITIDGQRVNAKRPWDVARLGVAHVPEDRALFRGLSVSENLRLGKRLGKADMSRATDYFPALLELMSRQAGLLSGGEQQMLALGRALVESPRLLIVDEMSLGLAPVVVERMMPVLRRIADETNAGVLLVEQHVDLALGIADWAYVLSHGELVEQSSAADLSRSMHRLETSYFGEVHEGDDGVDTD